MTTTTKTKTEVADQEMPEPIIIEMYQPNLQFIPGPKKERLSFLNGWCKKNLKGQFKAMEGGMKWIFFREDDAENFATNWNSRRKPTARQRGEEGIE